MITGNNKRTELVLKLKENRKYSDSRHLQHRRVGEVFLELICIRKIMDLQGNLLSL